MKVSLTLEQRFVLCFTLFWGSGFCSDQRGVGLHVQHVHHLYQQRPWGVAMRAAVRLVSHLYFIDMLVCLTSMSLIRNPEQSSSGLTEVHIWCTLL